jgi:hypothetical protein
MNFDSNFIKFATQKIILHWCHLPTADKASYMLKKQQFIIADGGIAVHKNCSKNYQLSANSLLVKLET